MRFILQYQKRLVDAVLTVRFTSNNVRSVITMVDLQKSHIYNITDHVQDFKESDSHGGLKVLS